MVAARREKKCAWKRILPDGYTEMPFVEAAALGKHRDPQVEVTPDRAGERLLARGSAGGAQLPHGEVPREHGESAVLHGPIGARAIPVRFEPVAGGIVQVEGFAEPVE